MLWTRILLRGGLLTALSALGPLSTGLSAQALPPLTLGHPAIPPSDSSGGADPYYSARLGSAAIAGLLGAAAGGGAGYLIAGKCPRSYVDQCEFHGWTQIGIGLLVGGILGSAAGAAWPEGRRLCGRGQRFRRSLAGATLGALAGVGLSFAPLPFGFGIIGTIPVGSVMFMRRC